ncbi:MAG: RnfABCDGE type electron transport complex subunit G [Bacteroidales bacterium]|nr:RnfABCDGE type electron transport complex subunit G [Bacteroidales bacterium]
MAKKQSSLINMVLTLFVITTVAAVALGFVYYFTQEPISKVKEKRLKEALTKVLPEFDHQEANDIDGTPVYKAFDANNQLVGTAIEAVTDKGFGGDVKVLVGFDTDGKIFGYSVLEHKETAGLGSKMGEWFQEGGKGNVIGKDLSTEAKVRKDGGDVDAITAATISSRAFCDVLNRAYATYKASGNTCAQQADAEPQEEVKNETAEPANVEPTNEGGNDNE